MTKLMFGRELKNIYNMNDIHNNGINKYNQIQFNT